MCLLDPRTKGTVRSIPEDQPLYAVRAWSADAKWNATFTGRVDDDWKLVARHKSVYTGGKWPTRKQEADQIPSLGNTSGLYSVKEEHRNRVMDHSDLSYFGYVKLWGVVVEHDLGFRSEFQEIVGNLYANVTGAGARHKALEKRYGIKVVSRRPRTGPTLPPLAVALEPVVDLAEVFREDIKAKRKTRRKTVKATTRFRLTHKPRRKTAVKVKSKSKKVKRMGYKATTKKSTKAKATRKPSAATPKLSRKSVGAPRKP